MAAKKDKTTGKTKPVASEEKQSLISSDEIERLNEEIANSNHGHDDEDHDMIKYPNRLIGRKPMAKKILLKLKLIADKVKYLQLDDYNKDQKFKYVKASTVMAACRKVMLENNIIMTCNIPEPPLMEKYSSSRGGNLFMTHAKITATFWDLDSDESISFDYYGTGMDSSDKGIGKAITYGIKYALLKTFMIETGEDETDSESLESVATPASRSTKDLEDLLRDAANEGMDKLKAVWETILTPEDRRLMQKELVNYMEIAKKG